MAPTPAVVEATAFAAFPLLMVYRVRVADRDRRQLSRAFSLYLPRAEIDRMLSGGAQPTLGGEERTVSILFSDIAGFSAISERQEPRRLVENLNYSARGLMATWPKWFPDLETATKYARQPDKIANYVYAGRMGNMEPGSGDGYRYRGRGLIQITGRTNYEACGKGIGQPLLSFPQKLEDPIQAARSAAWYWRSRNLDAVVGDIEADTKAVNGGLTGIEDRKALYTKAKEVLGV